MYHILPHFSLACQPTCIRPLVHSRISHTHALSLRLSSFTSTPPFPFSRVYEYISAPALTLTLLLIHLVCRCLGIHLRSNLHHACGQVSTDNWTAFLTSSVHIPPNVLTYTYYPTSLFLPSPFSLLLPSSPSSPFLFLLSFPSSH